MPLTFGVFIHRADSIYRDTPTERYHFPRQYLNRVNACVGDWVLYYEPRKTDTARGYFAAAHVRAVIADESAADMYFALITPGSYIDFPNPVPFRTHGELAERGLLNEVGIMSGRAQSAVRPIASEDFERIIHSGLDEFNLVLPRVDLNDLKTSGFEEASATFISVEPRGRIDIVTSRVVRDRAFRALVLSAYDERCALSGLKLINGGGRAEVNAAHIVPVEKDGPDSISNGLALSGTAHWMFDRGLIGLSDNLQILISRHVNDLEGARSFLNRNGTAALPIRSIDRPHPKFLRWHRENCFKG